jgi:hypothetical protein
LDNEKESCYSTDLDDYTISKKNVDDATFEEIQLYPWKEYRSATEMGETYRIAGEFATYTGDGYTMEIDPYTTELEEY